MKIGINASFLRKQNTGIGQVTLNFIRKLSEFESGKLKVHQEPIEFFLYMEEDIDLPLPENFQKRIFLPIWKRDDLIRKILWEKFCLKRKIKRDRCDIFLSMYQSATILPKSQKHIMIVHDVIPEIFPQYLNNLRKKIYWSLTKKAVKECEKIISVSHRTEKDVASHFNVDPSKITVSYIDVDEIYKKEIAAEDKKRILEKYKLKEGYIYNGGGLEVRKNTEGVLRAYKILLEKFSYAIDVPKLVISGRRMPQLAPLVADVDELIKALDITDKVILLDYVPQEDLPAIYAGASMFVYPSHYEGFGLPVLEAMNQAIPVIVSKVSSLPEIGSDGVLYCHPEDIDEIALIMKKILTNSELRKTLSERGKQRAGKFSWDHFTAKIFHVIESIK